MFKNWFRPDVVELEERVKALEKTIILLFSYMEYNQSLTNNHIIRLNDNTIRIAQAVSDSIRPFPGQSSN